MFESIVDENLYTTKEVAEMIGRSVSEVRRIRSKYKEKLTLNHCKLKSIDGCNALLWTVSGVEQLKKLFKREVELKKGFLITEHISDWITKKDLATNLSITPAKLGQYFNEIEESLLIGIDYGYWQHNGSVRQCWSKAGIAKLHEYIEYLYGYKHESKNSGNSFTQSDFDNAIADLESQIADLKFKYPRYVSYYEKNWIVVRAEYESGGVTLQQLANRLGVSSKTVERRSSKEQWVKNKPIQLIMATDDDNPKEKPEETIFDRMKAYAAEIGFEIKTRKFD